MVIIKHKSDPKLFNIHREIVKYNLLDKFGIELGNAEFDSTESVLSVSFEEKITPEMIQIIEGKVFNFDQCFGIEPKAGAGAGGGSGGGKTRVRRKTSDKSGRRANSMSFKVEDPKATAVVRLYFNPKYPALWKEMSTCFINNAQTGVEKYSMKWENAVDGSADGYVEFTVSELLEPKLGFYVSFTKIKNFAVQNWVRTKGLDSEEQKAEYHIWSLPPKWHVDVNYSDGTTFRAIDYDWKKG